MTEIAETKIINKRPFRENLRRLGQILLHPKQTMREVAAQEKSIWLFPLLLLMATSLLLNLSVASATVQDTNFTPPPEMEFYPEEALENYDQVMSQSTGFAPTVILPTLGKWIGVWIAWVVLSTIFMVTLLLQGHSLEWKNIFNVSGWSTFPFTIRNIVQMIYVLLSRDAIEMPGLSGFVPEDAAGFMLYLGAVLSLLDIYLLWQGFLIFQGVKDAAQLTLKKAFLVVGICFLIYTALIAVPGFITAKVSTLFSSGMNLYF